MDDALGCLFGFIIIAIVVAATVWGFGLILGLVGPAFRAGYCMFGGC